MDFDFRIPTRTSQGPWRGFTPGAWQDRVNLRDFIQRN